MPRAVKISSSTTETGKSPSQNHSVSDAKVTKRAKTDSAKSAKSQTSDSDSGSFSPEKCEAWFQSFAHQEKKSVRSRVMTYILDQADMAKFWEAAGIEQDDIAALILSQKLGIRKIDEPVTQQKWMTVMTELECDNNAKLKRRLSVLGEELKKRATLLTLCEYAFNLVKEPGDKVVSKTIAVHLFAMVLKSTWPIYPEFKDFFEASDCRCVSFDTFGGMCDLANRYPTLETIRAYDAATAWPSLADEFVEAMQKKYDSESLPKPDSAD